MGVGGLGGSCGKLKPAWAWMEALEGLYLPRFPDGCSVFFHATLHFALVITYGPLGSM